MKTRRGHKKSTRPPGLYSKKQVLETVTRAAASGTTTGSASGPTTTQDPVRVDIRCRLNQAEVSLILEALSSRRDTLPEDEYEKRRDLSFLRNRIEAASRNFSHPTWRSYAKR